MDDTVEIRNPRHQVFADNYLRGGSATQAAIDAGYSVRTASVQAAQMLSKPDVASYVAAQRAKSTANTLIDATRWQTELGRAAFSNIDDFISVDGDGNPTIDLSNATRDQLAAVQSVKTRKRTIYNKDGDVIGTEQQNELRLWDKLRALELLGKHAGFLKDTESRVVIDVADRLLTARGRVMQSIEHRGDLDSTVSVLSSDEDGDLTKK